MRPDVFGAAVMSPRRGHERAIAERAGVSRDSLNKALAPAAKPRHDTDLKVLHSRGVKLIVSVVLARQIK